MRRVAGAAEGGVDLQVTGRVSGLMRGGEDGFQRQSRRVQDEVNRRNALRRIDGECAG